MRALVVVLLAVLLATLLSVAGCRYQAPLTTEHRLPVDDAVLGLWEEVPDGGDSTKTPERMLVLKYSATEYLIHYPMGEGSFYFRGYPTEIAGRKCVQLEIVGTEAGPPKPAERKLFDVLAYRFTLPDGTRLEARTLNAKLVAENLATTEALVKAFRQHKDDKELFTDPGTFRRVRD